jgi:hypothetical protein
MEALSLRFVGAAAGGMLIFAAGAAQNQASPPRGANKSQISHEPNCERGSKKTAPYMGAAMFDLKISPVKMLIYRLLCKQPPRALASCANFVGAGLCFECVRSNFPRKIK